MITIFIVKSESVCRLEDCSMSVNSDNVNEAIKAIKAIKKELKGA